MNTIILFIFIFLILLISGFKERCESGTNIITALPKDYTNALRGLAIIMIMYGHVCGRYHESVWFSPFACTGVALFLFLSGYGNNESFIKKEQLQYKQKEKTKPIHDTYHKHVHT